MGCGSPAHAGLCTHEPWRCPDTDACCPSPILCRTAEKAAAEEPSCECMFCGAAGPEFDLSCAACRRALPFCAASGRRMVMNDWSSCPGEFVPQLHWLGA